MDELNSLLANIVYNGIKCSILVLLNKLNAGTYSVKKKKKWLWGISNWKSGWYYCFFLRHVKMSKEPGFCVPLKLCAATLINFSQKKWKPAGDVLDVGSGTLMHHCQHPVLHGISVAGATGHHQWDFARSHQKRMTSFFCVEPLSKSRSAACVLDWHVCSPCITEVAFMGTWWTNA